MKTYQIRNNQLLNCEKVLLSINIGENGKLTWKTPDNRHFDSIQDFLSYYHPFWKIENINENEVSFVELTPIILTCGYITLDSENIWVQINPHTFCLEFRDGYDNLIENCDTLAALVLSRGLRYFIEKGRHFWSPKL